MSYFRNTDVYSFQEHRRSTQAERLREQQRESKIIRATASVQAAFRRRRQARERRSRTELLDEKKRREQGDAAVSQIQKAWRRHRAVVLDQQQRREGETPPLPPLLSSGFPGESRADNLSVPAPKGEMTQELMPGLSGDHPELLGTWPVEQPPDRDKNSSREDWSAFNPPQAAAKAWERLGAATAASAAITDGDRRNTKTSDKDAEESAPSHQNGTSRLPPASMMTVRVKRGSEETSLVTPIVLTESGAAGSEAGADGEIDLVLDDAQNTGAHHQPWAVQAGGRNAARTAVPVNSSKSSAECFASGDERPVFVRPPSAARLTKEAHGDKNNAAKFATPVASTAEDTVSYERKHQTGDARSKALAPTAAATRRRKKNTARPWSALAATTNTTLTAGGEGDTVAAAASGTAALDETQPAAEQFFMEDSQVYLGCATCGVKYLVEAVDPRLPESAQGILTMDGAGS